MRNTFVIALDPNHGKRHDFAFVGGGQRWVPDRSYIHNDEAVFVCGSGRETFEFVFAAGPLRTILQLGADALREMDSVQV